MKSKLMSKSLLALFAGLLLAASTSEAAVITLQSGTGLAVGAADPNVTVLQGTSVGDFAALTAANFAAAQAGPAAFVVAPHAAWVTPVAAGLPQAQWVSVTANGSANLANNPTGAFSGLYAISFNLTGPALTSAVLNLTAFADNVLGSAVNSAIYLNGTGILASSGGTNNFTALTGRTLTNLNVLPLLHAGLNTLYFDVVNTATGPSGLMFSGTITTTQAAPIANVLGLLALGGMMLMVVMRRSAKN